VLQLVAERVGHPVDVRTVPRLALRALGLVNPLMRALAEMAYEFESAVRARHHQVPVHVCDRLYTAGDRHSRDGRLVPEPRRDVASTIRRTDPMTHEHPIAGDIDDLSDGPPVDIAAARTRDR
jgi:hypothetical protein